MIEVSLDGKVAFVKELDNDRVMVAVNQIGAQLKDMRGKKEGLRLYVNVFFPGTFRGVRELKYPDIVRVSGRITAFEEMEDVRGKNTTIIRISIHGYSIVKALFDNRYTVERELGVAR
jgi:hypothetical protein